MAVDVLISKGVPEDHILFLNLIASPEGAENFAQKYPRVRVVTAFVDQGLNERKYVYFIHIHVNPVMLIIQSYIVPGLGDFGDRFYTI